MSRSRETVILLANPTAGGGAASRVARQAVYTFSGLGLRAFLVTPAGPEAAGAEVRRALAALRAERVRPRGLVAVGGDGTVRLAARLAYRARLPLGVVPAGTGNGAAYSLGLPLDPWEACRVVARGVPVPCDLGRLEFIGRPCRPEFFLNVAGVGLDADITRVYHQGVRRLRGVPGYVVAALRSLASTGPTPSRTRSRSGSGSPAKSAQSSATGSAGSSGPVSREAVARRLPSLRAHCATGAV
ncbi:MAG: hypothetical protein K6U08_02305 [Firmicutes bacterium]|nr:hypothetical protein [Bacillota bacterium]